MHLFARTLRYLAGRYLTGPERSSHHVARSNAAGATTTLRERRQEQDEVDAYLRAQLGSHPGAHGTEPARDEDGAARAL
jgi:hypothetical protein